MGLFSSIKKVVKKVVKSVKKVFKKVLKFVGKIASSKWGKALMIASAVFTGGMALSAGFQGFTQSAGGFLTKFVAGAKEFVGALANPMGQAKKRLGGAEAAAGQAATASGAAKAATQTAASEAAQNLVGAAGGATRTGADALGTLAAGGTQNVSQLGQAAAQVGKAATGIAPGAASAAAQGAAQATTAGGGGGGLLSQAGGLLKKAGGAALDFAKSDAGGQIISGVMKGYAEGAQQEEQWKEEERIRRYYDNQWRDPSQIAMLQGAVAGDIQLPGGDLDRARRVNSFLNERQYAYPTAPGAPGQVAGYAVGPGG